MMYRLRGFIKTNEGKVLTEINLREPTVRDVVDVDLESLRDRVTLISRLSGLTRSEVWKLELYDLHTLGERLRRACGGKR